MLILKEASDKHILDWGGGQKVKKQVQIKNNILSRPTLSVDHDAT